MLLSLKNNAVKFKVILYALLCVVLYVSSQQCLISVILIYCL